MLLRLKYDVLNFDIIYNENTSLTLNPNQLEEIVQYLYKLFKKVSSITRKNDCNRLLIDYSKCPFVIDYYSITF